MLGSPKGLKHLAPCGKPELRLFLANHTHMRKQATNSEIDLMRDSLLPCSHFEFCLKAIDTTEITGDEDMTQ